MKHLGLKLVVNFFQKKFQNRKYSQLIIQKISFFNFKLIQTKNINICVCRKANRVGRVL